MTDPPSQTTDDSPDRAAGFGEDALQVVRGFLMGGADVIPGVSGGTVALIVGIYDRLVGAISSFDLDLASKVRSRQFAAAVQHIDLRFLIALAAGIALGIVSLGGLMNHLLADSTTRPYTLAAFFGMILASAVIVYRMMPPHGSVDRAIETLLLVTGAVVAYGITLIPTSPVDPSLPYLFFCGMVAICAMILPGISGAYILLILGAYEYVTHILKHPADVTLAQLFSLAVFGIGCATGLLAFSRVLKWLLAHRRGETLAVLCGFMIGALRKIWPFQNDLTPTVEELKHKQFELYVPESFSIEVAAVVGTIVIATAAVFALDYTARRIAARRVADLS